MPPYRRYGIYFLPEGAFFEAGSAWLGWDSAGGCALAHPTLDGLPASVDELTDTPRKYGFHGTIKPPFFLREGTDIEGLQAAMAAHCAALGAFTLPRMVLRPLGGFVAIVPEVPSAALAALAAATVEALDDFRAPPSEAELARRRKAGLSARQEALLGQWGYPYVMEEFRFHLTLTGKRPAAEAEAIATRLAPHFAPVLPEPFPVNDLALLGEAEDGRFHLIHRYALSG